MRWLVEAALQCILDLFFCEIQDGQLLVYYLLTVTNERLYIKTEGRQTLFENEVTIARRNPILTLSLKEREFYGSI